MMVCWGYESYPNTPVDAYAKCRTRTTLSHHQSSPAADASPDGAAVGRTRAQGPPDCRHSPREPGNGVALAQALSGRRPRRANGHASLEAFQGLAEEVRHAKGEALVMRVEQF